MLSAYFYLSASPGDVVRLQAYIFGIVDMLLWPIASKPVGGDFKLFGTVAKTHKAQNPEQYPYGFGTDVLHCTNINRLAVVPKPVAKVDPFDVQFAELLAASGTGHEYIKQGIFDVSVTPVLPFDFGNRG